MMMVSHEDLSTDHVSSTLDMKIFSINGKMNLIFFSLCLTILLMELVDMYLFIRVSSWLRAYSSINTAIIKINHAILCRITRD